MSDDEKPLTRIEWMQEQLREEDFNLTEVGINTIVRGEGEQFFEDALIDFVMELDREWAERS